MPQSIMLLPLFQSDDDNPVPLIVATKYGFLLQYHITHEDEIVYAIQDWIAGLTGETDAVKISEVWRKFKTQGRISIPTLKLPYKARDGKTYQRDYVTDEILYQFAAYARSTKDRPQIADIKDFLAKAGVLADMIRQDKEKAEQDIRSLRAQQARLDGKDESWIAAREKGIMTRNELTALLVKISPETHIGGATNRGYKGSLGHDAKGLREKLGIGPKQNPRDHMSEMGLIYTMAWETAARVHLEGYAEDDIVPPHVVNQVIDTVSAMIGKQASETATLLGIDIVTGRKSLKGGDE